jgi:predicted transcriptional regulator of viral defense system
VEEKGDGVRVTDMERTIIDSINDFEKIGGIEELLKCLELVPYADEEKLLLYLCRYNKEILYRKSGYILSHMKSELRLSERFFHECATHTSHVVRNLYHQTGHEARVIDKTWRLSVPTDLMKTLAQGEAHAAV